MPKSCHEPTCFYCGNTFGINETTTQVRAAVKPPRTPYRWVKLGSMCEDCDSAGKPFQYEEGEYFND